jgi:hypothetical protein
VSASCAKADACVSALVQRACELKADAVIVERAIRLDDEMARPTYQAPLDPQRVGEAPQPRRAPGARNLHVADGRLIVWLDE